MKYLWWPVPAARVTTLATIGLAAIGLATIGLATIGASFDHGRRVALRPVRRC